MKRLIAAWNRYWFAPASPTHLSFARMFFFVFLLVEASELNPRPWADVTDLLWVPVSFFEWFGIGVFGHGTLETLQAMLIISCLMSSLGLLSRVAMPVAALLVLYFFGLSNNFGKVNHSMNAAVILACMLAVSRAGDHYSVDAWLKRRFRFKSRPPERSGEYRWPIRVAWLCTVMVYFAAGVAKLDRSGLNWALSDNLRWLLLGHQYSHHPPTGIGAFVAGHPWLYRSLAFLTLTFETLCPLALVHPVPRLIFGAGLFGMQLGIYLSMGVVFKGMMALFVLFWPPWGPLIEYVGRKLNGWWESLPSE